MRTSSDQSLVWNMWSMTPPQPVCCPDGQLPSERQASACVQGEGVWLSPEHLPPHQDQ